MKNRVVIVLIIIGVWLVLVGCVVSQAEYDKLASTLESTSAQLSQAQTELEQLRKVYPPKEFQSLTELENWARQHLKDDTTYADETFRNAYETQQEGIKDGYLISIDSDYNSDDDTWIIWLGAFAGDEYYSWTPIRDYYDGVFKLGFTK